MNKTNGFKRELAMRGVQHKNLHKKTSIGENLLGGGECSLNGVDAM